MVSTNKKQIIRYVVMINTSLLAVSSCFSMTSEKVRGRAHVPVVRIYSYALLLLNLQVGLYGSKTHTARASVENCDKLRRTARKLRSSASKLRNRDPRLIARH